MTLVRNEKEVCPYMLEHQDNIKLSRYQYIATSVINYCLHVDNMFSLENFTHNFCNQLTDVVNSSTPTRHKKDILMPKYNQILLDRYNETTFLLQKITKLHQKLDQASNHISEHPNMANSTIF